MVDYISREAALSFPFANDKYDHENANEHFIFGCETYKEWLEQLPAADVVEWKWIPVSEEMPEEDYWTGRGKQFSNDVLMTVYNANDEETMIDFGHTVDGNWYSEVSNERIEPPFEVLAWMPLPEPYKERQE